MRHLSFYLLLVFVFSVPWQNAIQIGGSKTLSSIVGIVAVSMALLKCLVEGRLTRPPWFFVAFGALVSWQLATYFWSGDPTSTLAHMVTMVQMVAMVWLISESCVAERERLQVMEAFVFGCIVASGALINAYLAGESVAGYRYTPGGFDPNELACVIAAGIPIALLIATSPLSGSLIKWINILYIPLGLFAVILTASRTGFIATVVGLSSVFFALRAAKPAHRLLWSIVILAVFIGAFTLLPAIPGIEQNIQRITFSADTESLGTLTTRTTIWSAGLETFSEHPVVGVGFGTFSTYAQSIMGQEKVAHNLWVQTAAETGVIGLVLLVFALGAAVAPTLKRRGRQMPIYLILFLTLMATSLALDVVTNKPLWIALAVLATSSQLQQHRFISEPGSVSSGVAAAHKS